jgi:protein ImuB
MSNWIALLPAPPAAPAPSDDTGETVAAHSAQPPCPSSPKAELALRAASTALDAPHLAWWALQFTPRVALLEDAVVMEVQASERLFGGAQRLWQCIHQGAQAWQVQACAPGHTALGALVQARRLMTPPEGALGRGEPLPTHSPAPVPALDGLTLHTLSAVAQHQATLARLGCRTLGQVRQLPRAGLSRRFGAELLRALDQAWGDLPLALSWVTLPPRFDARLELPGRVETAPALQFAAERLLTQLCAWLAGMQSGVTAFTLAWLHDGRRHDTEKESRHTIRLGSPSRDLLRLARLLGEHLQRITLAAPVTDISLHADAIERLPMDSLQLFQSSSGSGTAGPHGLSAQPDALLTASAQRAQRDALSALLDKLSVRLGDERVLQGQVVADHRLELAQRWRPAVGEAHAGDQGGKAGQGDKGGTGAPASHTRGLPQPCWLLASPLSLRMASEAGGLRERPQHQGPLQLLAGPHRIEAGWWDDTPGHAAVVRDYYLASSAQSGLLWVYKERLVDADTTTTSGRQASALDSPWFLHGFFA